MSRISVVIASLLKPIDDARMYEKFGRSLAQKNKYEINIIGFYSKKIKYFSNIHLFPIFNFKRLSPARIFQPLKYFKILLKVKPEIIIVTCHDLLTVTLLYTWVKGAYIIYDVQENYYRNIIYNSNLPALLRYLAASFVRVKEYVCHPFIDFYLVAEKGYFAEMSFLQRKGVLIRNSYVDLFELKTRKSKLKNKIRLLYSGTIAKVYGIFQIINFITKFHDKYPEIELIIIGYCAHRSTLRKIREKIKNKPYIRLIGGNAWVPHEQIIEQISNADFGIVNYELNPAIANCFPTRIYEYIANRLPILIQNYSPWSDYCLQINASIEINFESPDFDSLILKMKKNQFYIQGITEDIFWKQDEQRLLELFDKITRKL